MGLGISRDSLKMELIVLRYYFTFELATGGDIFDRIRSRGKFTERDAQNVIR